MLTTELTTINWLRTLIFKMSEGNGPRPRELVMPQKSVDVEHDIPSIPDIDELAESSKVLSASGTSKPTLNQSAMYQELDSELLKQNAFVALDGINLSALLKFIHPDVNTKESDSVWTIDSLFKDLSEYYHTENNVN